MIEAALYILTGVTLYAGAHHLLVNSGGPARRFPLSLGVMYLLLSGFALASALTYEAHSVATLLPAGKIAIALGILLWVSLIWFVAFRSGYRPLVLLDILTAVWIIFLIKNGVSANSLLYADSAPYSPALSPGQDPSLLQPVISPWWIALELTMLVSLLYALYASYRLYVAGKQQAAMALGGGLSILLLAAVSDHLVNNGITHIVYLAPFGFAGFLMVNSLYPRLATYMKSRTEKAPAVIYNLPYIPEQATFHSDVADLKIPLRENHAAQADSPRRPTTPVHNTYTAPPPYAPKEVVEDVPVTELQSAMDDQAPVTENPAGKEPVPERGHETCPDQETLDTISDNLIDIAVFATMTMNRIKRGDADPKSLEMLCKKVRTQAIKTRRLANQFSLPVGKRKN